MDPVSGDCSGGHIAIPSMVKRTKIPTTFKICSREVLLIETYPYLVAFVDVEISLDEIGVLLAAYVVCSHFGSKKRLDICRRKRQRSKDHGIRQLGPLSFVSSKKERLVFLNWPAKSSAKLIDQARISLVRLTTRCLCRYYNRRVGVE